MSMDRRWLTQIMAVLGLTGLLAGAWWQSPDAGDLAARREERAELAAAAEGDAGEGCALLVGLEPVDLLVRREGGSPGRVGTGYREPGSDRVLAPVRRLVAPLAPGPLGVHWEEGSRTATMLREGSVLSIHFPHNRNRSAVAIVNGEAVGADAALCEGRLYAPLRLLAGGLNLRVRWRDARSIVVEAR